MQAGGQRFESVILHILREKGAVRSEKFAAASLDEIFDILTHKTVSKDFKLIN